MIAYLFLRIVHWNNVCQSVTLQLVLLFIYCQFCIFLLFLGVPFLNKGEGCCQTEIQEPSLIITDLFPFHSEKWYKDHFSRSLSCLHGFLVYLAAKKWIICLCFKKYTWSSFTYIAASASLTTERSSTPANQSNLLEFIISLFSFSGIQ